MRSAAWIAVLVGLLGSAAPAAAQPRRNPGAVTAPGGNAERREQIKKKIRALRAYTLTEELALDEQTAARLFPVLARYDDETDRLLERRVELQRRLRRADALRDPRAIERLIDEAVANQRGFWDLEDRRLAELRKILTPVQTAKLLVALPALERRIQNQLRKAISRRPGAVPGAEADDADDDLQPDDVPPRRPPRFRREVPLAPRGAPSGAPGSTPTCDPSTGPCR
jgi:hypothetical protein